MGSREVSIIRHGLKVLGYIEHSGKEFHETIYRCKHCNSKMQGKKVLMHFARTETHKQIYSDLKTLVHAWGLVGSTDGNDEITSTREFQCSCGKAFNGSLFNHRMKEGHKTILQARKEIEIIV